MQKISTLSDNCRQKDRTESESYAGVQTFIGITENDLVEVQFTKEGFIRTHCVTREHEPSLQAGRVQWW